MLHRWDYLIQHLQNAPVQVAHLFLKFRQFASGDDEQPNYRPRQHKQREAHQHNQNHQQSVVHASAPSSRNGCTICSARLTARSVVSASGFAA